MTDQIPRLDTDPFTIDNLVAPYGMQDFLRRAGPVFWLDKYATYGVAQHGIVADVLNDPANFISSAGIGLANIHEPGSWREPGPLAEADPPQHTRIRSALNKIVAPKIIMAWKGRFREEADRLCDEVLGGGEIDAMRDLVNPFIHNVLPAAIGIQPHQENLTIIGHHNLNAAGPQNELFQHSQAQVAKIAEWFKHHQTREALIPGGLCDQIFAAEENGSIPPGTASTMVRTILRAGLDTTISGLASTLRFLAMNPVQWRLLKDDPSLISAAFHEAIRLESPASSIYRTTAGDACIAGHKLAPGTKVQVFIGAGNRDPQKWHDSEAFDIRRDLDGHLAFGHGIHTCLGRNIARMEAESLICALIDRVKDITLAADPVFQPVNMLRTYKSLPLSVSLH